MRSAFSFSFFLWGVKTKLPEKCIPKLVDFKMLCNYYARTAHCTSPVTATNWPGVPLVSIQLQVIEHQFRTTRRDPQALMLEIGP